MDRYKQDIDVYLHPFCDGYKEYKKINISSPIKVDNLPDNFKVHKLKEPFKISPNITYLGQIPRTIRTDTGLGDDELLDDTALVYENDKGIFIITACSHSGIENIVEYSMKITGKKHILGIIGGFHMQNDEQLNEKICAYLSKQDIEVIYPCHCTDLKAKIALSKYLKIQEVGVSYSLEVL